MVSSIVKHISIGKHMTKIDYVGDSTMRQTYISGHELILFCTIHKMSNTSVSITGTFFLCLELCYSNTINT